MGVRHLIDFDQPAQLLSLNRKMHWAAKADLVRHWRRAAFVAARNARVEPLPPCVVNVTFHVAQRRRRDPHNFIATVKPIDGLVDAKVWPDDTGEWVAVVDPTFRVVPMSSPEYGRVVVRLEER